ncbi:MAG: hypothetical protein ACK55I_29500, partial [bacterium]
MNDYVETVLQVVNTLSSLKHDDLYKSKHLFLVQLNLCVMLKPLFDFLRRFMIVDTVFGRMQRNRAS